MLISGKSEVYLKELLYVTIGAGLYIEREVRFNLARLLLKYYKMVLKGEDDNSASAESLRNNLIELLSSVKDQSEN